MNKAAVWWRVSTDVQKDISPDTQMSEALALAQAEGYEVPQENILGTDWHSLSVWESPPMEKLKELIRTQAIQAVFMYDPDRGPSKPAHRLLFRTLCQENGVRVCSRHGQVPDGDMGEVMEFLSAWAKEKSVLRSQQGSRDGLRDRAKLKGLPAIPRNPYGYVWDEERKALLPTADWEHAKLICQLGLAGWTLYKIRVELHTRSIPSPSGLEWWGRRSIYVILSNPLYGGRYYALRAEDVLPKKRRSSKYGKTSAKRHSLEESHYLPNIQIHNPPLTWEEWLSLQERFEQNKLQASRNAKTDYLLRGVITCEVHHHHYAGHHDYRNRKGYWQYFCYSHHQSRTDGCLKPCSRPYLNGPELENKIKDICRDVLTKPELIEAEVAECTGRSRETLQSLERQLVALDTKEAKALDTETNLVILKASGEASPEAYEKALVRIKGQRAWIIAERQRLKGELAAVQKREGVVLGLREARERLLGNLERGTTEDWREVLNALGVKAAVGEDGVVQVSLGLPVAESAIVCSTGMNGNAYA